MKNEVLWKDTGRNKELLNGIEYACDHLLGNANLYCGLQSVGIDMLIGTGEGRDTRLGRRRRQCIGDPQTVLQTKQISAPQCTCTEAGVSCLQTQDPLLQHLLHTSSERVRQRARNNTVKRLSWRPALF